MAHFTGCRYEAGSSYTGGALTAAAQPVASVGGHTATKQDCCDACARVPSCAKFVYEVYSGSCQLFSPIAERYYVQGLISGTMTSRNGESLGLLRVLLARGEAGEAAAVRELDEAFVVRGLRRCRLVPKSDPHSNKTTEPLRMSSLYTLRRRPTQSLNTSLRNRPTVP